VNLEMLFFYCPADPKHRFTNNSLLYIFKLVSCHLDVSVCVNCVGQQHLGSVLIIVFAASLYAGSVYPQCENSGKCCSEMMLVTVVSDEKIHLLVTF